jgi:hypothetical protein
MEWIKIEIKLPREMEEVLLFDGDVFWVGMYQKCQTIDSKDVIVWWASNPNKISLGHQPFLSGKPKYWTHLLKPKLENEKPKGEIWIKEKKK